MPMRRPILLVEDNELLAQLTMRRLGRLGWKILLATTGPAGLAAARSVAPAAVLLDMSLPEMDGWAVVAALRADPATAGLPVLALTAHALPADRDRALAAGCDSYLVKPIDFDALAAWLRSATAPKE